MKTKIIIADDHRLFADGLQNMLALSKRFQFLPHASDGVDLLNKIEKDAPHLVLLDVSMPNMNGIEAAELIKKNNSKIKILVVTMNDQPETLKLLIRAGVEGIVLKNAGKDELLRAIDDIIGGQTYFSQKITRALATEHTTVGTATWQLTNRERQILKLIHEGLSSADMAATLGITTFTVDTHRKNLLTKSGCTRAAQLIKRAQDLGYLPKY